MYAFCRVADDIVDTPDPVGARLARLDAWERELVSAYRGRSRHALLAAFGDAARRFEIPIEPALDLLAGTRKDVTTRRMESYAELDEYCYLVASTVGLLTCPILGYADGALRYAADLGRAMQLTNILRDVGEDARLGRIYLPLDELRRFGYTEDRLLAGVVDESFVALMRFQIARARDLYAASLPGIDLLAPSARYTVRLAWALYRDILARIEANAYDVFTRRAFVPATAKLTTAVATAFAAGGKAARSA